MKHNIINRYNDLKGSNVTSISITAVNSIVMVSAISKTA